MTAPWSQLCVEAEACALDVERPTLPLQRLARDCRTPLGGAPAGPEHRALVRLSLGYCIETIHGRKHACAELAATARAVLALLPEPHRPFRADIDG